MKRRDFISTLACSAAGAAIFGNSAFAQELPNSTSLVATPEARKAYLAAMLKAFCTDIGPHPVGSKEFEELAKKISVEMQRSLPKVGFDRFGVNRWQLDGQAEFRCGDKPLDIFWGFGAPGTPAEGIRGVLKVFEKGHSYGIVDPDSDKLLVEVIVSHLGRAVALFRYGKAPHAVRRLCVNQQDVPILDKAVAERTPVLAKANVSFDPNATSCNIVGTLPGKQPEEILLLAHADSQYNTVGANDNMASMIAMLMLAHAFSGKTPKYTLTFVATNGEEYGMVGAAHYAETRKKAGTLKNVKFCLNFDSLTWGPNIEMHSTDKELMDLIREINSRPGMLGTPKEMKGKETYSLDEVFFKRAGARTVYANSYEPGNKAMSLWHRPEDTPETVRPELIENAFLIFKAYIDKLQEM